MEVYVNCLILIYTREQFEIEEDTEFERHWPNSKSIILLLMLTHGLILTS